jgi:4-amino-4-deoxy-L-arabinose transferase-like glycosyltransferase
MLYMRFESVAIGTATVLLIYILARQMYGQRAAIISSFLLFLLPWHIIYSRIKGRLIWVPFFGCLIFLSLFKAIKEKDRRWAVLWFLVSCFLLRESLKAYESAVLFIPIFFISLICLIKEIKSFVRPKVILIALLTAFLFIFPFIYTIVTQGNKFWQLFYRYYHKNIFAGPLFFNIFANIKNNIGVAFKELFFNFGDSHFLYGEALNAPLLVHPIVFFLFVASLVSSFCRRNASDKILLIWLFFGFLGAIGGLNIFEPRYLLVILPPLVIFIGKFIGEVFIYTSKENSFKRTFLLIAGTVLLAGLITTEVVQWARYYYMAPFNLNECINNSYGCKEAAEYLSGVPDIKSYDIITDSRMTVVFYLSYYLLNKGERNNYYNFRVDNSERGIYVLWAPESHPVGLFRQLYDIFRQRYPQVVPIKTIYYPNGLAAIHIFIIGKNYAKR